MKSTLIVLVVLILIIGGLLWYQNQNQFTIPSTETATNTVKHSIPLDEILSGGPPKDGIPSIDNPQFVSTAEADSWLMPDSLGVGLEHKGVARFYPFQILVWHELVNDTVAGDPILVSYCPLCATAIVFDRRIDGVAEEFGVSGKLWQSNLLMYNRASDPNDESLWSQVLGEAVVGTHTGTTLPILITSTVQYGKWKEKHPDTEVLSRDTGATRLYGSDPYGDYYTDETVSFGATFTDQTLHPKTLIHGIEYAETFKAYPSDILSIGTTTDTLAGSIITVHKNETGEVRFFAGETLTPLPHIDSFWFSWLAVHPQTQILKEN